MNKFSFIELVILQMLDYEDLHGYAMSTKLSEYSEGNLNLPAGSLYPALHKLERLGLVSSSFDSETGRKRRTYSITSNGEETLAREIKSWRAIVKTMNALIGVL